MRILVNGVNPKEIDINIIKAIMNDITWEIYPQVYLSCSTQYEMVIHKDDHIHICVPIPIDLNRMNMIIVEAYVNAVMSMSRHNTMFNLKSLRTKFCKYLNNSNLDKTRIYSNLLLSRHNIHIIRFNCISCDKLNVVFSLNSDINERCDICKSKHRLTLKNNVCSVVRSAHL